MVPVITVKEVDMSGSTFQVDLGFVPDFVMFLDVSNTVTGFGKPGGSILEVSDAATTEVTSGVTKYTGSDFAGLEIDPLQFTAIASASTVLVCMRQNG